MKSIWTDQKKLELTEHYNTTATITEIAELLGPEFTRGSVSGKARTMGLKKPRHSKKSKIKRLPSTTRYKAEKPCMFQRSDSTTSLTCQWPFGQPKDSEFHFCGESINQEGRPYCDKHLKKAYIPRSSLAYKLGT